MTALGSEPSFTRGGPVWPVGLEGVLPREMADPRFFLPEGALERGARDAIETWHLVDQDPLLRRPAAEPLAPVAKTAHARRKWWTVAIVASLLFHSAVALFFLEGDEQVLIEGSEQAGITMLGNASEDQVSSGDAVAETEVTTVTIVQNVMARTVETIAAEAVPVEATEVVETQQVEAEVAMAEPVEEVVSEQPVDAVSEAPTEPALEAPVQPVQAAETIEEAPPAPAVDPAPQIMAMETIAPETDTTAVPPVTDRAPAATAEIVEATPVEVTEAVREEPVKESLKEEVAKPKKAEVKQPSPPKKAAEKPAPKKAEKKVAEKPAPAAKSKAKAGSGGKNAGDSRKGAADGQEAGTTAASGKNGQMATAGNASVSNYPGKVVSKLRRALRYPSEARAQRLRGEVQVAFTVSSNGSVGGIRVVRSSGSPILDKAAIETVRRAAPFPAIPDGRKSWPFTVPLAFVR